MIQPIYSDSAGSRIVFNAGLSTPHEIDEIVDWTAGPVYVLMQFHTPFEAQTPNGLETGRPGQMLINTPGERQWHRGLPGQSFTNDWIHLAEDVVKPVIEQCNLPINEIFSVSNSTFLGRMIADITRERLLNAPNSHEMIACHITEMLLLTRRYYQIAQQMAASPVEYAHYEQMCTLRQNLQTDSAKPWTVREMAKHACLSPNRFAVLYKKFFQVSPMDDLIEMRLAEAKWLLSQGTLTVAEVAERCGFNSLSYFSRQFKLRTGQTPKRFRI